MSATGSPTGTPPQDLDGRVAVVTGAARGQGRAHVAALAARGATVVAVDLCAAPATTGYPAATAADLERTVELAGGRAVPVQADVRDLAALGRAIADAAAPIGTPTLVVANAGIVSDAPLAAMEAAQWQEVVDTNLTGAWNTIKATVPAMLDAGLPGSVVVISSANGGLKAPPHLAHYSAAKHGLVGLVRSLARELGPAGIRVNSVHPTAVATDMLLNDATYRLFRPDLDAPGPDDVTGLFAGFHSLPVPWVEPADVAAAVAWLLSDRARYVTGVALPVDAGLSAR